MDVPTTRTSTIRNLQVLAAPSVGSELLLRAPARPDGMLLYWLGGMGMPARQYLPLSEALAERGIGSALHEWRGIGSSSLRAGRDIDWGYRELLQEDLPAGLAAARRTCPDARILLGGHSLGGQLACLYAGLQPEVSQGLVLAASGAPYWRCFTPWGLLLRVAYAMASPLARLRGYFPGRRLGFGGNEARGVIADWSRSGLRGMYAAEGLDAALEVALAGIRQPILALRMADDVFGPGASLRYLLDKMPHARSETLVLDAQTLTARADHFTWIKHPDAVAVHIAAWVERAR
jgi:predicted alpha/beta hydrolase